MQRYLTSAWLLLLVAYVVLAVFIVSLEPDGVRLAAGLGCLIGILMADIRA